MSGIKLNIATEFAVVVLTAIRPSPIALRAVNRESEKYQNLVQDINRRGILSPLTVRLKTDLETQDEYLELINGLHRLSACIDLGIKEVAVRIMSLSDAEALEVQLVSNTIVIEQDALQVTEQLLRLLALDANATTASLAVRISKSESYVAGRLGLNKLDDPIKELVKTGELEVTKAITLSKMTKEDQHAHLELALNEKPDIFAKVVKARLDEVRALAAKGKPVGPPVWKPVASMRKLKEVETVEEETLVKLIDGAESPLEVAKRVLAWVQHLDPEAVALAKGKDEQIKKTRAEDKKRSDAIKAAAKLKKATETAAKTREASGLTDEEIEKAIAAGDEESVDSEITSDATTEVVSDAAEPEGDVNYDFNPAELDAGVPVADYNPDAPADEDEDEVDE